MFRIRETVDINNVRFHRYNDHARRKGVHTTMTRTIIVLCLALFIALSFGCSKKKEQAPQNAPATEQREMAGKISPSFDPVSKEEIDPTTTPYSYELDGVVYFFTSAENMEAFKADPAKYLEQAPATGEQAAPEQKK